MNTKSRLLSLVKRFSEVEVIVVGDVGLDLYTSGVPERFSPEAPVPVITNPSSWIKLGLASNVAENIVTMGGRANLFGVIGQDEYGVRLRDLCIEKGILGDLYVDDSRPTTVKHRICSGNHHFVRIDHESTEGISAIVAHELLKKISPHLNRGLPTIVQDYAKGVTHAMMSLIANESFRKNSLLVIDPNKKTPLLHYFGATVMTPNVAEAEALSGQKITDQDSLIKAGKKILSEITCRAVIITRGADGIAIFDRNEPEVHTAETYARNVFDVSGAGDTFTAALTLARKSGGTWGESAVVANLAAGLSVSKSGTAVVTQEELLDEISSFN